MKIKRWEILHKLNAGLQLGRPDQAVMSKLKKVKPLGRHLNLAMPLQ